MTDPAGGGDERGMRDPSSSRTILGVLFALVGCSGPSQEIGATIDLEDSLTSDSSSDSLPNDDSDDTSDGEIAPQEIFTCAAEMTCPTISYSCDYDLCHLPPLGAGSICVYQALLDGASNGTVVRLDYFESYGGPPDNGVVILVGDGTALVQEIDCVGGLQNADSCTPSLGEPLRCELQPVEWYEACLTFEPIEGMLLDSCQVPGAWFENCEPFEFTGCPQSMP